MGFGPDRQKGSKKWSKKGVPGGSQGQAQIWEVLDQFWTLFEGFGKFKGSLVYLTGSRVLEDTLYHHVGSGMLLPCPVAGPGPTVSPQVAKCLLCRAKEVVRILGPGQNRRADETYMVRPEYGPFWVPDLEAYFQVVRFGKAMALGFWSNL